MKSNSAVRRSASGRGSLRVPLDHEIADAGVEPGRQRVTRDGRASEGIAARVHNDVTSSPAPIARAKPLK